MRYLCLSLLAFLFFFQACKKNNSTPIIAVNAGLSSNFDYKPGSYWIYKDSISGAIDSAYVTANEVNYYYEGCVLRTNEPKYEFMSVLVSVSDGNSLDTERWSFTMSESKFNLGLYNNNDKTEANLGFNLFTWPLATGVAQNSGCVLSLDSGAVTDIIPEVSLNGQNYINAARSAHMPYPNRDTSMVYNDCFYVNQDAGLIKVVFNHPSVSVHRVLELQRYHLVR